MSSNSVPLWVPIVVALAGLAGVLGAQLIAGRREDQRWARELAREEARWRRELDREERNRSYQARELAYVKFIGAVEALDWQLYPALRAARHQVALSNELTIDLRSSMNAMSAAFGPVIMAAPQAIRDTLPETTLPRARLARALLAAEHLSGAQPIGKLEEHWQSGQESYKIIRDKLRADLTAVVATGQAD